MPKNAPGQLPKNARGHAADGSAAGSDELLEDEDPADHSTAEDDDVEQGEPFKPPSFLEAIKLARPRASGSSRTARSSAVSGSTGSAARPARSARPRAQPATGTAADAMAVKFLDRRERMIAGGLAALQLIVATAYYFQMRRLVVKPTKKPKLTVHQAHVETLNYHHAAPWFLLINLVLGLGIGIGVFSKRRSLVGFTLILAGLGLVSYLGIVGFVYVGVGIWLIFRARKRAVNAQAQATAGTPRRGRGATGSRTAGSGPSDAKVAADRRELSAGAARTAAAVRQPPVASKRYTPPKPRRTTPQKAKPAVNGEEEKGSRLTSWLRR